MSTFLDNAQRIFEVARTGAGDADFALLVRPDGGLHVVMESEFSLAGAAIQQGARTAYRVVRSGGTVRITGRDGCSTCVLEARGREREGTGAEFLRDQPLYLVLPPVSGGVG